MQNGCVLCHIADAQARKIRVRRPVSRVLSGTTIHLGRMSPCASRGLPGRRCENAAYAVPIWPCSRRGLPCRRRCRRRGALLPHPFTLTCPKTGGLLSAALSVGSRPPGVTRRRVSVEPGLSSNGRTRPRPSGHLTGICIRLNSRSGNQRRFRRELPSTPSRTSRSFSTFALFTPCTTRSLPSKMRAR